MAEEELIYVKFDYPEALETKRGILSVQKNLIEAGEKIGRHHELRIKELNLKTKLLTKMRVTASVIKMLREALPIPRIPKILKHGIEEGEKKLELKVKKNPKAENIESQLREIQEKLRRLQG